MGPVSFQRIGDGLDRAELLRLAGVLTDVGIKVQLIDEDRAMVVRSEDGVRAQRIIDGLGDVGLVLDEDEEQDETEKS